MDSTPLTLPGPDSHGIDRMQFFRDCESGGAWPFLVRGVNCLLNCDNGRDLCLVTECRGESGGGCQNTKGTPTTRRTRKKRGNTVPCALHVLQRCACAGRLPSFLVLLWWPSGTHHQKDPRATPSQGLLLIKRRKREAITGQ